MENDLYKYCLRLGDTSLILSHRLSEYSSNGPFLEEDLAITNVGLDLLGQAEAFFKYAAEIKGGLTVDDLAYRREEIDYYNLHLVEYPNEDFAFVTARQFLMDVYNYYLYTALKNSSDSTIASIAAKSLKEVTYHLKRSSEWVCRLGDGTTESHQKIQSAIDQLWMYTDELFDMDETDQNLVSKGIAIDLNEIKTLWNNRVNTVLADATLEKPEGKVHSLVYGKKGGHTEYMGYLLNDMQYLTNKYPDAIW